MNQNHGDSIYLVGGDRSQGEPEVDALITQEIGVALVVLVADCIPLLLWDELHGSIAAVHVGRRGLVNGIASKTVEAMRVLGAKNISASLGPSICGKCYEVNQDLAAEVVELFPMAQSLGWRGSPALDLPAALEQELDKMKVQVLRSEICTYEDENYFSYRRDGVTGRQAGMISL